ncbi:transcriptional regulator, AsnC family [Flagellimonas taeanensis]|uniref:Transcriptional regulator, AsnC family n=5 Tax=Flagellimonas TaxID=444459 RepID=A0A1M7BGX1_9FLAO|nr:transcriptional regulator, AsnC family [Allomuricauda taeanensis]SHL53859.1 transcriptional regulator, AsnC family [Allomuricauda taeanensis]
MRYFDKKYVEMMVDGIDNRIIGLLRKNSRYSFAEIGRIISLSPSSVRERIQKLEDLGIIESYSLKVNYALLGYGMEVFILLKIFDGKLKYFLEEIHDFVEVEEAYRITGPYNIHIRAILRDQKHLQDFVDRLINYGSPTTLLILSDIEKNL